MKTVKVRNIVFGEGRPKICVPLTGRSEKELRAEAVRAAASPCDLIEWRADCFEGLLNPQQLTEMLQTLRELLGDLPILFTIRTDREGGSVAINTKTYTAMNIQAIESELVDLVDVELSRGEETFSAIVAAAHRVTSGPDTGDALTAAGTGASSRSRVAVVGSRHDFEKTPPKEEIVNHLCRMQQLGADIAKFAVMPRTERDVLTLLDATLTMKEAHDDTPVITMAMGKLGVTSRIAGGVFGSCLTFGTAGNASAPGQLPAEVLAGFLAEL